ncbi:MAG: CBS domain-containing protein [Gaiellaceae bacterium]
MTEPDNAGSELLVAADLMVANPKTLGADASVAEVRDQLADPKVQMVLLTDGRAFKGAVTRVPADAASSDLALVYVDADAHTISPHASADEAFERAAASPNRRVIVLDDDQNLLGLLCLNQTRTGFCGIPETAD